jgi:glucose/arabinose dehydrogenase
VRRAGALLVAAMAVAAIGSIPARAQDVERFLRAQEPVSMAWTPDGSRLFFDERATGDIRVAMPDGTVLPQPFAHLDVDTGSSETGLLGIAIHPEFPEQPFVYVYASDPTLGINRLLRFRADGDVADGPPQVLLDGLVTANRYHNGGDLVFGSDGMLYVTVGESHQRNLAQDPTSIGGKVLRLARDGSVPPDDPIPGNPRFTLGHRNSFGICFDPATGDLWETENGPTSNDEVNLLRAGGNYGWPDVMGDGGPEGTIDPVVDHVQQIAPTGCAVWHGELYYGSYLDGAIRRLDLPPGPSPQPVAVALINEPVYDLVVGHDDRLYVSSSSGIWRFDAPPSGTVSVPPPHRVPRSTPWWGRVAVAVAVVLAIALALRIRGWRVGASDRSHEHVAASGSDDDGS